MKLRVMGIVEDSIVDGPGLRLAIFTQGCPHHCPGCHNPSSHAYDGGTLMDVDEIIQKMDDDPLLDGITLTGGEPFEQPAPCATLARAAHARDLSVWCYTGYRFEALLKNEDKLELLHEVDCLVDGRFEIDKRSLELRFRGSSNQRIIDVPKSLATGTIIEG